MELGESEFLTYDRRQAQAAAERGFTVIAPGQPGGDLAGDASLWFGHIRKTGEHD